MRQEYNLWCVLFLKPPLVRTCSKCPSSSHSTLPTKTWTERHTVWIFANATSLMACSKFDEHWISRYQSHEDIASMISLGIVQKPARLRQHSRNSVTSISSFNDLLTHLAPFHRLQTCLGFLLLLPLLKVVHQIQPSNTVEFQHSPFSNNNSVTTYFNRMISPPCLFKNMKDDRVATLFQCLLDHTQQKLYTSIWDWPKQLSARLPPLLGSEDRCQSLQVVSPGFPCRKFHSTISPHSSHSFCFISFHQAPVMIRQAWSAGIRDIHEPSIHELHHILSLDLTLCRSEWKKKKEKRKKNVVANTSWVKK